MTTNTTNSQVPEILAKQVAEWRKEVARLNDLIAHAEGRDSQAASIDTPEFQALMNKMMGRLRTADLTGYNLDVKAWGDSMKDVIAYIDAKLAQIEDAGWTAGRQQCYIDALERAAVAGLTHDRDEWKARATAAEAKLEAIRQGVEGLDEIVAKCEVLALFTAPLKVD